MGSIQILTNIVLLKLITASNVLIIEQSELPTTGPKFPVSCRLKFPLYETSNGGGSTHKPLSNIRLDVILIYRCNILT